MPADALSRCFSLASLEPLCGLLEESTKAIMQDEALKKNVKARQG